MNAEKMNSLSVLGAYVRGTFDAATSRGVLTQQSLQTMINSLIGLYGEDQFTVQESESLALPAANPVDAAVEKAAAGIPARRKRAKKAVTNSQGA